VDGKDEVSLKLQEEQHGRHGHGCGKHEVSITNKSVTELTIKLTCTLH